VATKRQDTQWKRLYTYICFIFYVTYHTCKYAYTYTYSPLSPSSWLRARRIKWCERPCACIELDRVSPRVQSYIISLYDYVIKTVSLSVCLRVRVGARWAACLSCLCCPQSLIPENGEKCEKRVFRCYVARGSHAGGGSSRTREAARESLIGKSGLPGLALLFSAWSPVSLGPVAWPIPKNGKKFEKRVCNSPSKSNKAIVLGGTGNSFRSYEQFTRPIYNTKTFQGPRLLFCAGFFSF